MCQKNLMLKRQKQDDEKKKRQKQDEIKDEGERKMNKKLTNTS